MGRGGGAGGIWEEHAKKKNGFLRRVPKKKIKEKGRVERNSEIRVEN